MPAADVTENTNPGDAADSRAFDKVPHQGLMAGESFVEARKNAVLKTDLQGE